MRNVPSQDLLAGRADRGLVLKLGTLCVAMFAFGFALVPLYGVFCKITGLGGKTDGRRG